MANLLVGRVRIAPAQIFRDRAREQHVLLQHHRDLIAQRFEFVVTHVDAAHFERAGGDIVQARDELHKRRLRGTGAADDADRLPRTDVQVDVIEHRAFRVFGIAERHMVEVDRAVGHGRDGLVRLADRALLGEHATDTFRGCARDDDHDENHREHHHRHHDLHRVRHERGQVARRQAERGVVAGRDDLARADPCDRDERRVHAQVEQRRVDRQQLLRLAELLVDLERDAAELLAFEILTIEGLDDAHALQVLVDDVVELIVRVEDAFEDRVHDDDQAEQADREHRDAREEHHGDLRADAEREDPCDDEHDRRAHADADEHLVRVLHVRHVGREPGDDRARRKTVDVREAELLHLLELVMAQVLGKTGGTDGREPTGQEARAQRHDRAGDQDAAVLPDVRHGFAADALIDKNRDDGGDGDLYDRLNNDE